MSIGKNIKNLRLQHGLEQADIAKIAGVTNKAVSAWETGLSTPRMGAIQKLADYFHILKSDIIEDKKQYNNSMIFYSGDERKDFIAKEILKTDLSNDDLKLIEFILNKYKK